MKVSFFNFFFFTYKLSLTTNFKGTRDCECVGYFKNYIENV